MTMIPVEAGRLGDLMKMSAVELKTMIELSDDDSIIMDCYTDEQQKAYNKFTTEYMAHVLGDSEEFLEFEDWIEVRAEFHHALLQVAAMGSWLDEFKAFASERMARKPR